MDPKQHAVDLIQELIKDWGLEESEVKDNKEEIWWFTQGSSRFHIQIFPDTTPDDDKKEDAIEVCAHIMELPEEQEKKVQLYEHVLDMNNTSIGVWFAVRNNALMLMSSRTLKGLDKVELKTMTDDVRLYADYFDDIFKERFGSSRKPAQ